VPVWKPISLYGHESLNLQIQNARLGLHKIADNIIVIIIIIIIIIISSPRGGGHRHPRTPWLRPWSWTSLGWYAAVAERKRKENLAKNEWGIKRKESLQKRKNNNNNNNYSNK